jgi:RNA polymerase sigma factor (sigma-70 family)
MESIHELREAVYKTILSIDELSEAENPTQVRDDRQTPEESVEFLELKREIVDAIKKLPQRERDLIEAKFFQDKKLKDLSIEFNISPSRISRIIQSGLNKVRNELTKQDVV